MAKSFLDYDGLAYLITKIKSMVSSAVTGVGGPLTGDATGDGSSYTVTIDGITALEKGLMITITPDTTSTTTIPTLNLNSLGTKNIKQRLSINTSLTVAAASEGWMIAGKPVPLLYDGNQWVTITGRPSSDSIYGEIPVESGGTGATTAAAARTNLGAVNKVDKTVSLSASGWSNQAQTVSVAGVTDSNTIIVTPAPESHTAYGESGVRCTAQASGKLTFTCEDVPSGALTVNVVILN